MMDYSLEKYTRDLEVGGRRMESDSEPRQHPPDLLHVLENNSSSLSFGEGS
ncbi:hypothetical protein IQ268_05455 [Oculatella sp. LEGE 06141]|uniref:hypothetical protein n=1 Tax=Oculatella sp. LEGE 06141 TaxID=1828648 RepID=UPI00187E92CE|nr:hypothetical protein [Oculatella sp. LEGE 06141]MBE9178031.1 hypothetical protein [Oculatella sp. LEGE 06141]